MGCGVSARSTSAGTVWASTRYLLEKCGTSAKRALFITVKRREKFCDWSTDQNETCPSPEYDGVGDKTPFSARNCIYSNGHTNGFREVEAIAGELTVRLDRHCLTLQRSTVGEIQAAALADSVRRTPLRRHQQWSKMEFTPCEQVVISGWNR